MFKEILHKLANLRFALHNFKKFIFQIQGKRPNIGHITKEIIEKNFKNVSYLLKIHILFYLVVNKEPRN